MMRLAIVFLTLALLVPAGLALQAQEEPSEEKLDELIESLKKKLADRLAGTSKKALSFELHLYDVRDLVQNVYDYPGEEMNLMPSGGYGFGFGEEEELEPLPFYEGDVLVDMILENVAPGSWSELRSARIDYVENGVIMVRHTPGVHARIRELLDALRSRAASQVVMEMQLLRAADATVRSILAAHVGSVLDQEAEARLNAMVKSGEVEVVSRGSMTCTNTQRVSLNDVARVSYVQDYDVEIAQGSSIPDPIMSQLPEGLRFDVRPVVAGDGDLVVMEVRADASKLHRPMGSVVTQLGPIETPVIDVLKVRTTVAAPLGRPVIIGGSLSDGEGRGYLLVVKPTATRPR